MGIAVDISICAIFLIVLIVGWVRGFIKQLSGLLRGLVSIVGAIILAAMIINLLRPVGFYESFVGITTGWFKSDLMNQVIDSPEALSAALSEQGALKILAGLSDTLFNDMQSLSTETLPCNTLGALLGHFVADIICGVVLWILLFILLRLVFKGLISLVKDIIVMPAFKTFDRILGMLWALALTYVILIGVILGGVEIIILKFAPQVWGKIAEYIQSTTVLFWLHDTNIIGEMIAGFLNVTIPSLHA